MEKGVSIDVSAHDVVYLSAKKAKPLPPLVNEV